MKTLRLRFILRYKRVAIVSCGMLLALLGFQNCAKVSSFSANDLASMSNGGSYGGQFAQGFVYVNGVRAETSSISISSGQTLEFSWGTYGLPFDCGPSQQGEWKLLNGSTTQNNCARLTFSNQGTFHLKWVFTDGIGQTYYSEPEIQINVGQ